MHTPNRFYPLLLYLLISYAIDTPGPTASYCRYTSIVVEQVFGQQMMHSQCLYLANGPP